MAQLTLSEKSALAENSSFRSRLFQGLFSKANYHRMQTNPQNLKEQKQQVYAPQFLKGGANTIDIHAATRFWLSNYNADPPEMDNGQPSDNAILNTVPLDVVYDSLAGVLPGDENISI